MNALIRKLECFAPLPAADKLLLEDVIRHPRMVEARTDIIREGETPNDVRLILEGFACRYKMVPDGGRQNMAYLIPGDFCDLHVFLLKQMDHGIATMSRCKVVEVSRQQILALLERPAIARAFWWAALVDEATLREWLVNVGVRSADQRVAHLLCELLMRLRSVGLTNGDTYELPLTQFELADTVGLSPVHVNRVIQRLRAAGLITFKGKHLVILDIDRLIALSGFTSNYLHLDRKSNVGEAKTS